MTSTVREPKFPVLAGCLKGLSSLLCNFTKSMEEGTARLCLIFFLIIRPYLKDKIRTNSDVCYNPNDMLSEISQSPNKKQAVYGST